MSLLTFPLGVSGWDLPSRLLLPLLRPSSASHLCPPSRWAVPSLTAETVFALLYFFSVAFPMFLASVHGGLFWIDIPANLNASFLLWSKRTNYSASGVNNLWYFGSAWQDVLLLGTHGLPPQWQPFFFREYVQIQRRSGSLVIREAVCQISQRFPAWKCLC